MTRTVLDYFTNTDVLMEGRNSFYSNIVFLSNEDKDALHAIGIGMFEGFTPKVIEKIKECSKSSTLFKSITKESRYILEDYQKVYWRSKNKIDDEHGFRLGTINEGTWTDSYDNVYTAPLRESNVVVYFPTLYNWIRHYTHSPKFINETFATKELIKSVYVPLEKYYKNKNILVNIDKTELVEAIKPNNI
jgi:hypothetical protein